MLQDTEFIIVVTERFHWLMEPLLYMYRKYMPVPLTFFSDRLVEGSNAIEVFPRDMQIYKEPCGWLVKDALRALNKPIVMFGYMDMLPTNKVNLSHLGILEQYMLRDCHVARGNMWSGALKSIESSGDVLHEEDGLSIRKLSRSIGQIGATSLLAALWRTDFLLDFIDDGWTFDAIESHGQYKFATQNNWYAIGTVPALYDSCHLCYTANTRIARLSTISNDVDRAYVAQFVPKGSIVE